ncbi:hypothetical protein QVZ43_03200 [Marinobacter sp. chi1]|uniref:DUF2283 domain-containing protein n=1 Tax=Marinobacter suaedae TaxID=3057675 RepID=A0ABT8VXJ9_9GAMM|nr:hypothetical protein [Marinobacter sp. chi1]MDO3720714.1 hypothetical protein [Marinobacter sp. chi1]
MELELSYTYDAGIEQVPDGFLCETNILEKNAPLGSRNARVKELTRDDSCRV